MSGSIASDKRFDHLVSEQDYLSHITYQASFSRNQLNTSYFNNDFPSFYFDSEGLPVISTASSKQSINLNEYPSFPLKHLMEFFGNVNSGNDTGNMGEKSTALRGGFAENLSLLVLIVFLLPGLILRKNEDIMTRKNFAIVRTNKK